MKDWDTIDWYGQLGTDQGRDIWAVTSNSDGHPLTYCFQYANHRILYFDKAREDIDKVLAGPNGKPANFILITGGKVSATMKDRIRTYGSSLGIKSVQVWSGIEFEERLRKDTPSLVRRFCAGEAFPESAHELRLFAGDATATSDREILILISQCFDRPAFTTPFRSESSVPDFKKAITDTIEVLNTGLHRLRDGTLISKIPSRHDIQDTHTKDVLTNITGRLAKLRTTFDSLLASGDIKPCGCGKAECHIFFSNAKASAAMDRARSEILAMYQTIYPEFKVRLYSYW